MPTDGSHNADLWAITSYFNPARSRRRLANYRQFRRHLALPLLTVEWSRDGTFELGAGDADRLLRLRGGDVLWQKERLLNIALTALPSACRKVLWVDADLLFPKGDWPDALRQALDRWPLVQPYRHVSHLAPDQEATDRVECRQGSLVAALAAGRSLPEVLRLRPDALPDPDAPEPSDAEYLAIAGTVPQPGFAWAARREILQPYGFYDARIAGGGDVYFACAALGHGHDLVHRRALPQPEAEHYLAWAEPFTRTVDGAVGGLDLDLRHLWHGSLRRRRYRERDAMLHRLHFEPRRDLCCEENEPWHWNSDKPLLHRYLRDYFAARVDDDVPAGVLENR